MQTAGRAAAQQQDKPEAFKLRRTTDVPTHNSTPLRGASMPAGRVSLAGLSPSRESLDLVSVSPVGAMPSGRHRRHLLGTTDENVGFFDLLRSSLAEAFPPLYEHSSSHSHHQAQQPAREHSHAPDVVCESPSASSSSASSDSPGDEPKDVFSPAGGDKPKNQRQKERRRKERRQNPREVLFEDMRQSVELVSGSGSEDSSSSAPGPGSPKAHRRHGSSKNNNTNDNIENRRWGEGDQDGLAPAVKKKHRAVDSTDVSLSGSEFDDAGARIRRVSRDDGDTLLWDDLEIKNSVGYGRLRAKKRRGGGSSRDSVDSLGSRGGKSFDMRRQVLHVTHGMDGEKFNIRDSGEHGLATSGGLAHSQYIHVELGTNPHDHRTVADLVSVGLHDPALIDMELHGHDARIHHEEVLIHEAIMEEDVCRKIQFTVAHSTMTTGHHIAEELAADLDPRREMPLELRHEAHISEVMRMVEVLKTTGVMLFDIPGWDADEFADQVLDKLVRTRLVDSHQRDLVLMSIIESEQQFPHAIGNGYDILTGFVPHLSPADFPTGISLSFARLKNQVNLGASDKVPTRFVFVLLISPSFKSAHYINDVASAITFLMSEEEFHCAALETESSRTFLKDIDLFVERMRNIEDIALIHHVGEHIVFEPERLANRWMGGYGKGLWHDISGRYPLYWSDFKDVAKKGNKIKALSAILFLFLACLAPALTFGELTATVTGGHIGLVEMMLASSAGQMIFALFSGQPLIIVGGTGPLLVISGVLFDLCVQLQLPFLPVYAWTGIWCGILCGIAAVTEASVLIHYCTRFTDEIFELLVAIIFVIEASKSLAYLFVTAGKKVSKADDADPPDLNLDLEAENAVGVALLSLLLAILVFYTARLLRSVRQTAYLSPRFREFVSDVSHVAALFLATVVGAWIKSFTNVEVPSPVISEFGPSLCVKGEAANATAESIGEQSVPNYQEIVRLDCEERRAWTVNLFDDDLPIWWIFLSIIPAMLTFVLLFLEHNIAQRLINRADHKLKKPVGYHLDMLLLGLVTIGFSIFGLPWIVAGSVRSVSHLRALSNLEEWESDGIRHERVVSVREQRVTCFAIALLLGATLIRAEVLSLIPTPVYLGLFFAMGIAALGSGQFFDRLKLLFVQPSLYPPSHYSRRVPPIAIHAFTLIQFVFLAALVAVKLTSAALAFPLGLAVLIPFRLFVLPRIFSEEHLEALDAEEDPDGADAEDHVV